MKKTTKETLYWFLFSTFLGVLFGLVYGILEKRLLQSFVLSFSIAYTIWFFNLLLRNFFLRKIQTWPREKRLCIEIPSYFITSVSAFFICMMIFSRVYGFDFFVSRLLLSNLGLLALIYVVISGLIYSFKFYKELKEKEAIEQRLRALATEVELKALKSHMNPHFLFNSLNSINALVTEDPKQAREMIARLSNLLRISLENRDKTLVSLKDELDFAHLYLDIERIRFRDRMEFHEEIDPQLLGVSFPCMVLQPLFENAIKYGIASKRGRGTIHLDLNQRNGRIECVLSNSVANGIGERKGSTSNGTALKNIRQRLDLLYNGNFDFKTGYSDKGDFEVILNLPVIIHGKNKSTDR